MVEHPLYLGPPLPQHRISKGRVHAVLANVAAKTAIVVEILTESGILGQRLKAREIEMYPEGAILEPRNL